MPSRFILFLAPAQTVMDIFSLIREAGYEAGLAENLRGAQSFIRKTRPAIIFTRPWMPGYKAEELMDLAAEEEDFPPVVVFTDRGSPEEAQKYLELGAKDYWLEPLAWDKVKAALPGDGVAAPPQAVLRRPQKPGAVERFQIVGAHPAMRRVLALAKQVAPSKATVLIAGESGTGKELFARFLHEHSDRQSGPFVAVNCAALPEHLLESELFGHEKGAFTGAISRKLGKFELASGGTILLDEISEMDLGLQAKLLRVLQESELDRVGGTETVRVDVRVLATTNRDLARWVEEGKFRQDLFFRLNVIPLKLPSLKDRGDDVTILARHFIDRYARQYGLTDLEMSQEVLDWFQEYDWPGNVRELQNLMERAVLLAGQGPVRKVHFLLDPEAWPLPEEPDWDAAAASQAGDGADAGVQQEARPAVTPEQLLSGEVVPLHEVEKIMILRGLKKTAGNRTQAADLLGISVRTLRNKLNEYRSLGQEID